MKSFDSFTFLLPVCAALAACGGGEAAPGETRTAAGTKGVVVGNHAPAFESSSVNGKGKISMSGLSGKVVIVDFWATWCEPCKKSFPKLQDLNVKYKASGLQMVGVSEDDDSSGIPDFARSFNADFPLVWDGDKVIAGKWSPGSMPSTFIVDRSGIVRFEHRGYRDGEELQIEKEIKTLL